MGTLCVSPAASYSLSCLFLFVSSLSGLGLNMSGREEDGSGGRAVDGRAGGLKWPGAGKNTHSVLEGVKKIQVLNASWKYSMTIYSYLLLSFVVFIWPKNTI